MAIALLLNISIWKNFNRTSLPLIKLVFKLVKIRFAEQHKLNLMSPGGKKRRAEAKLVLPSILRARPEVEEGRDEDSSGTEDVGGDIFNGSNNSQRVEKRLESLEKAVKNLVVGFVGLIAIIGIVGIINRANLVDKNENLEEAVVGFVGAIVIVGILNRANA